MLITVECEGEIFTHIPGVIGDYATICGLDGDDPSESVQQRTFRHSKSKVDCPACINIWNACLEIRPNQIINQGR